MDAILIGFLVIAVIIFGGMFVLGEHRVMSILSGFVDVLLVVLSAWRFRELLLESGKILTPELFGFGDNQYVLFVYALMALIGIFYVLIGVHGSIKDKKVRQR